MSSPTCCVCFACVPQGTMAVVEGFGKFNRMLNPGFGCLNVCCGESIAGVMSLRVQQLDVRVETKTKDNVFVNLVVSVQYQVLKDKLHDAFYRLTDSRSQITAYIFDVVRATVPRIGLDDLFVTKDQIAIDVKEELCKSMNEFGYSILQALVTDIDPDAKVKAAMNSIQENQRLRVAALEKAEADKVRVVKSAEAEAESKFLQGQGIARQRQAIINGLKDSVVGFTSDVGGVSSHTVLEMMLLTQYLDMLKDMAASSKTSSIFLPHNPGAIGDIAAQVRNGFLTAAAADHK